MRRSSHASNNRYSTATSGGLPSSEMGSEESEYSDGGTTFVRYVRGFDLQERRRERAEREAERQRQIRDFISYYRNDIVQAISTDFQKPVEEVAHGFDALHLNARYAWARWQSQASPRDANRTLLYDVSRFVRRMLDRNSTSGNSQEGVVFRSQISFGAHRRHKKLSDLSVGRITSAMELAIRELQRAGML